MQIYANNLLLRCVVFALPLFSAPVLAAPKLPATAAAQGQVQFVKWVDPTERAFSLKVPKGWQVNGGIHWISQIDARGYLKARSPDGKVQIFIDDPDILTRQVPHPAYAQMGWVEGKVVQAQTGPIFIQRFQSGSQYAQQHVTWRLCKSPRWVKTGDLPALSQSITSAIESYARASGGIARASAGEASFLCNNDQGYVFATTVLASSPSPTAPIQIWGVYKLSGFVSSDPMRSMQARYIMDHMMATFTPNTSWEKAYERKVHDVSGRAMAMSNALAAQVQRNAAQSASNNLARLNHPNQGVNVRPGERRSSSVNTTLGTKEVCDAIGRCKSVSNDYDTLYMDHSGNVVPGRAGGAPPATPESGRRPIRSSSAGSNGFRLKGIGVISQ